MIQEVVRKGSARTKSASSHVTSVTMALRLILNSSRYKPKAMVAACQVEQT